MISLVFCAQEQPKIIEPLDYEAVVFQRKAQIHSDPNRDLLLCPVDDVSVGLSAVRMAKLTHVALGCGQLSSLPIHLATCKLVNFLFTCGQSD